ncbi:MAG: toll/interleukin-1 receptor domain-containing protein [Terriglobales bacterium]
MANREHLARLKEGVEAWNDWRRANNEIVPDLRKADLGGSDLRRVNLRWAELIGAKLSKANLTEANLSKASLRGAELVGANLGEADFRLADLYRAHLDGANLTWAELIGAKLSKASVTGANLSKANLRGADLTDAIIGWTTFLAIDLSDVKGLETVRHNGPSTIDIDTIYLSHGKIPPAFLRGAGVPENFIEYMGSLTGKALEFYSCFISYSTKNEDQEFADRLHADLQNKGVRCWFAPHDIQAGKKIHEQIDEAIRRYERLLLILSTNSMKSPWVKTEIRKACKREIEEKRRVLFPVSIVPFTDIRTWESFYADEGIDLAEEIREYYIPDFSNWKNHDSYAKALKKLLSGLKAEASKAA